MYCAREPCACVQVASVYFNARARVCADVDFDVTVANEINDDDVIIPKQLDLRF